MDSASKPISQTIYKTTCPSCLKNTFALDYIPACSNCLKLVSKTSIPLENPIDCFIKPKCLIITKSFNILDPGTYKTNDILHIGLSNSKGIVYNFWGSYKKEDQQKNKIWRKVVNVTLDSIVHLNDKEFDTLLDEDLKNQRINYPYYDQMENNCYSYVVRFFNMINYALTQWNKEALALNLLVPKLDVLNKYCYLYQKLVREEKGVICEEVNTGKIMYSVCDKCEETLVGMRKRCVVCQDFDLCLKCFVTYGHEHEMKLE